MTNTYKSFKHFFAIMAVSITLLGCEKIKEASEVDVPFDVSTNFEVDNSTFTGRDAMPIMYQGDFDFDFQDIKDEYGIDGFEEAAFNSVTLEILSPADVDFSWLNNSTITIKTSSLSEVTVASYEKVAGVSNPITLGISGADISAYLESGSYTLTIYGTANTPIPQSPITIKMVAGGETVVRPL